MSDSCRVCGKVHCQSGEREYILDALGIPPDTYRMNDGRFLDIGGWHAGVVVQHTGNSLGNGMVRRGLG